MHMAVKTNSVDMIHGPLWGKILKFAALYMLTALLQHLYNAADVIVVGRFAGQEALAGVGTSGTIVNLCVNFILGLSAGATIVIGQAIGARDRDKISAAAHTAIFIAVVGGLIMNFVCAVFTMPLLNMVDVPDNVMPYARSYLRVMSFGFVPSLIYNFGSAILRAKGDTKRALYIVSLSGIVNVILNLVFVCIFKMQSAGVALATIISQTLTAAAILYILCKETDETQINLLKIRLYREPFLKILRYGLPSAFQSAMFTVSNLLVQSSVNAYGSAAIAGRAAATNITEFYGVMHNALYQAAMVFTSQNYGARKFERIQKTFGVCMTYVAIFAIAQVFVTYFCGEFLLGLYLPGDVEAIKMGMIAMNICGYSYILLGAMNVFSGLLRGMGASVMNLITSILGVCGVRMVWLLTIYKAFPSFGMIFLCFPLSWGATTIFHFLMYLHVFHKEKKKAALEMDASQA